MPISGVRKPEGGVDHNLPRVGVRGRLRIPAPRRQKVPMAPPTSSKSELREADSGRILGAPLETSGSCVRHAHERCHHCADIGQGPQDCVATSLETPPRALSIPGSVRNSIDVKPPCSVDSEFQAEFGEHIAASVAGIGICPARARPIRGPMAWTKLADSSQARPNLARLRPTSARTSARCRTPVARCGQNFDAGERLQG